MLLHFVCLFRLFETLQSLFWSVFGLISLYVTNVRNGLNATHEFTEFVGATMFGTYNIISLVVLLNMLIAMMNNSYQHIAVSHPSIIQRGLTPERIRLLALNYAFYAIPNLQMVLAIRPSSVCGLEWHKVDN